MKETYYFSHDYNARSDEKVKKLIRAHGILGYGIYWAIIEDLYSNANALRTDYEGIAFDLRVEEKIVKNIINDFDLFVIDGDTFGSSSVERRLNERSSKSRKATESANYRWNKKREDANALNNDANALRPECDSNAIKESKGKESKENKSKIKYSKILLSEIKISDFPEIDNNHLEIAKSFKDLFAKNLKEAGATTVNLDKAKGSWIDDVRHILETDKYTIDDLRSVYEFLQRDEFWKKNILSTSKLREKMDKLKMQINGKNNSGNSKEGTSWEQLASIVATACQ